jgi:hypothetical protein
VPDLDAWQRAVFAVRVKLAEDQGSEKHTQPDERQWLALLCAVNESD